MEVSDKLVSVVEGVDIVSVVLDEPIVVSTGGSSSRIDFWLVVWQISGDGVPELIMGGFHDVCAIDEELVSGLVGLPRFLPAFEEFWLIGMRIVVLVVVG